jgi:hypothetical protein
VDINRLLYLFALQLAVDALAFRSQTFALRRGLFGILGAGRLFDEIE